MQDSPITPKELVAILAKLKKVNDEATDKKLVNAIEKLSAVIGGCFEKVKIEMPEFKIPEIVIPEAKINVGTVEIAEAIAGLKEVLLSKDQVEVEPSGLDFEIDNNRIKLRKKDGEWSKWLSFAPNVQVSTPDSINSNLRVGGVDVSDSNPVPVDGAVSVTNLGTAWAQIIDSGNSVVVTSTSHANGGHNPSNPFTGVNYLTTAAGVQETITIVTAFDGSGNPVSDLGITFTFNGNPEGITRTVVIPRFTTKRLLHTTDWLSNQWTGYNVVMTPSRALVAGETIVVATRHSKLTGNKFLYPLDYEFLDNIQTSAQIRALICGDDPNDVAVNARLGGVYDFTTAQTTLGVSGSWVSEVIDVEQYPTVLVTINTDVASATNGVKLEWSDTLAFTNVRSTTVTSFRASDSTLGKVIEDRSRGKYLRITFTNGVTIQGRFYIGLLLDPTPLSRSIAIRASSAGATGQLDVNLTTDRVAPGPLSNRTSLRLKNLSSSAHPLFYGFSSGVTVANGDELAVGEAVSLDIDEFTEVYVICASTGGGGVRCSWTELA